MTNKKAYVWGIIARFSPSFIQLATNMFLARILLPQDFGVVGMLAIIYSVANTLVDSGLGGSLVKEEKLEEIDFSTISTFNIIIAIFLYFSIFLASDSLEKYFMVEGISTIIKLLSLTILIGAFAVVPNALLLKNLKFKEISVISITSIVLASIVCIVLALLRFGVYSLVAYQLFYTAIQMLLSYWYSKYKFKLGFSITSMKRLLPFGIFTSIITAVDTVYENILATLTGKYLNIKEAGFVSQSKRIDDGVSYSIAMTIGTVSFPTLTKLKNDYDTFRKEAQSVYKTISLLLIPVLMTIALFSDEIMVLLFGDNWGEAGSYLCGFMFAGMFLVLEALIYGFIKALCVVNKLAMVTLIKRGIGIAVIICTLVLYPKHIIYGYVISTAIGFMSNTFLYSKIISVKIKNILFDTLICVFPSIAYYLVVCFTKYIMDFTILVILESLFLLAVYYLSFLKLYGINIIPALRKLYQR